MSMGIEQGPESKMTRERVVIEFASREAAVELVKQFWLAMPHVTDLTLPADDAHDEWASELTAGDRTRVSKGIAPGDRGKWFVSISGNHQPLSREAEKWLRTRGL